MRCFIVVLWFSLSVCNQESKPTEEEIALVRKESEDSLKEVLALIEKHEVEAPEVREPSRCMIFVRKWGLSLAYAYYDFKEWLLNT